MKKKSEDKRSHFIEKLFPPSLGGTDSGSSGPKNIEGLQKAWELTENIASPDPATEAQLQRLTRAMNEEPGRSEQYRNIVPIWKGPLSGAANYSYALLPVWSSQR